MEEMTSVRVWEGDPGWKAFWNKLVVALHSLCWWGVVLLPAPLVCAGCLSLVARGGQHPVWMPADRGRVMVCSHSPCRMLGVLLEGAGLGGLITGDTSMGGVQQVWRRRVTQVWSAPFKEHGHRRKTVSASVGACEAFSNSTLVVLKS